LPLEKSAADFYRLDHTFLTTSVNALNVTTATAKNKRTKVVKKTIK